MDVRTAHALVRFGLGGRGSEEPPADPVSWLARQLEGPDPALAAPGHSAADGLAAIREKRAKQGDDTVHPVRDIYAADSKLALDTLLTTETPFRERLVWFWANHFTVSLKRGECAATAHAFIREAIRPHVNGRFEDMLVAVMHHPCMLMYLDNAQSIGPNSRAGQRQHKGLNENLARESLELHTLTPASGYTQSDVTEYAKILTGWSLELNNPPPGFVFRPNTHEPGPKTVLGRTFPEGQAGGDAILAWLAQHPATYKQLATKLVRHFVADDPPAQAVARIDNVLRNSRGDLKAASLELIRLPEAWQPLTKLRSPADYVIAVARALDLPEGNRPNVQGVMAGLGQPLLSAPLPNGWPDTAADWAAPESVLRRVDWAFDVAARAGALDPATVADATLGPLLPASTADQVRRAGSKREAFALLLASPEFQRR
jgi:uncharacterized protein (DUF1800 family)